MRLLLALVLTILAVIFYICYNVYAVGGSVSDVLSFLMAMGNTYGVLLITVLMGTGLVAIPKRLWLLGDVEGELNRLYLSVSQQCCCVYSFLIVCRPAGLRNPTRVLVTNWRTASTK